MQPMLDPTTRETLRETVRRMRTDHQWFQEAVGALVAAEAEREYKLVRWRQVRAVSGLVARAGRLLRQCIVRRGQRGKLVMLEPAKTSPPSIIIDGQPVYARARDNLSTAPPSLVMRLRAGQVEAPAPDQWRTEERTHERRSTNEQP